LNADGYVDIAMAHPMTEGPPIWTEIKPGTEEWAEHFGPDLNPKDMAAVYKCEFKRKDRALPFAEINYCTKEDSLLWNYKNRVKDSLKSDWKPLAGKIARTRALRRCLRFAFSPTEAAALYAEKKVENILLEAAKAETPRAVIAPDDPYSEPQTGIRAGVEVVELQEAFDPDKTYITEVERRKLFAMADRMDTGDLSPHEAIKLALRDALADEDPVAHAELKIEDVSTKKITYAMYPEVVTRLSTDYLFKDREVTDAPAEVESEEFTEYTEVTEEQGKML